MNDETVLRVQRHYQGMPLPAKSHPGDAGFDLTAMHVEQLGEAMFAFDSGVSIQVEAGYYCEVLPRSSIVKTDFMLANSVGVIDPDYRGRIRVVMRYMGRGDGPAAAAALVGQRIAQLLVRRLEPARMEAAETLEATTRGEGGFGSTGK